MTAPGPTKSMLFSVTEEAPMYIVLFIIVGEFFTAIPALINLSLEWVKRGLIKVS